MDGQNVGATVQAERSPAILSAVQVGTPQRYLSDGAGHPRKHPWTTSFFRTPAPERRWLFITHLDGNTQADTKNHGSPDQAVLLYAAAHYPCWQRELRLPQIGPGGFGENFTIDGLDETTVCVGDVYAIGEARIQVTGPRYPCAKISRRWGVPSLRKRVAETGRTGWYCRVLREGWVEPGLPVTLIDRPHPDITVALVNDLGHGRNHDRAVAQAVAACPLLPECWQDLVIQRVTAIPT